MKLIVLSSLLIVMVVVVFYFLQRSIIYHPSQGHPSLKEWGMADMEEVMLHTQDGLALKSWYKRADTGKATILYFQGNAGNIGMRGKIIRPYLEKGYGVLLLGYRGYNNNQGNPSEEGFYQDAEAGWNFLVKEQISPKCIVLYGESLGSGVAIELAHKHPVGVVILLAPYTSMIDLGSYHYPFLPVRWILKDLYDSLSKITSIKPPLLILAAENDTVIPLNFCKRLYEAANPPKKMLVFPQTSHNELADKVQKNVIEFLQKYIPICKF